ncbi:MAG: hypothetical protein E7608_05700 [Ruminococcaceae bacterium]|nr:hypothetical protein [Oscillospiraceae bacterium]
MKKRFLALLLALSVALLCACANTEENTSETTKATISPSVINISANGLKLADVSISAGEQKIEPFFVCRYTNSDGIAADGPLMFGYPESNPDMFYADKKQYPIIYCNTLEEIKFYVGEEEQKGIEIRLFDAEGEPVEFTGTGTYYAYANVQAVRENSSSSHGAFFTVRPVGTENEPIVETLSEDYKLNVKISEDPIVTFSNGEFDKTLDLLIFDMHESSAPYISENVIEGSAAKMIYDMLENAVPTGEKAQAIAEQMTLEEADRDRILEEGTYWFELESELYRMGKDGKIAKVESYLGAGDYLNAGEDFSEKIELILTYHPRNVYAGKIEGQDLPLRNICKNNNPVEMNVVNIGARLRKNGEARTFAITVELTAKEDTTVNLYCGEYYETNYYYSQFNGQEIQLKAGERQTISIKEAVPTDQIFFFAVGGNLIEITQ